MYTSAYRAAAENGDPLELPPIDKAFVRSWSIEQRGAGPLPQGSREMRSTGSTGEPFAVWYPPGFARWQGVLRARMTLARGIRPWARSCSITFTADPRPSRGLAGRLRRAVLVLSTTTPPDELAAAIERHRPVVLNGHPHLVLEAGRRIPRDRRPAIVTTSGETLDPLLRDAIRDVYNSSPIDTYGTSEVGVVAWQCRAADLYHVNSESVLVQIVDGNGTEVAPGETGEIVLSGLANPLMPYLRYRIGDIGAFADRPCRCGHRQPALREVSGRTLDWIVTAAGERIAPQRLWLFNHIDSGTVSGVVRRYHVHQDADLSINVDLQLEDGAALPDGTIASIERSYRALVPDVAVDVRVVERVASKPGEKFRLVQSDARP